MQDDGVGVGGAPDVDAHSAEHRYQHSHQHSAQGFGGAPKPPHRVEVIVGEPRRRRWSAEDKAQITAESFAPGANISAVARRYGVSAGLLHYWVLLTDFANGFYHGVRLRIDDWKPVMSDPEILMPMMAILGHCTTMISEHERLAAINGQAAELLAESWRVVPEVIEMLHVTLAASRNIEIR